MVERRSAYARQRVFIVDDHPLVREWLTNVINQQWDLTVCGESEGREGCIEAIEKKRPHVAIVDISLKDCSGFDLIGEIKRRAPQVQIMVLSMHSSPLHARRAFRAGANGYVVKTEPTQRICKAIRDVLNGVPFVSEKIASFSNSRTPEGDLDLTLLSEREIERLDKVPANRKAVVSPNRSALEYGKVGPVLYQDLCFFLYAPAEEYWCEYRLELR
jgi:DNA-binding NarL/FixJ family response regulator